MINSNQDHRAVVLRIEAKNRQVGGRVQDFGHPHAKWLNAPLTQQRRRLLYVLSSLAARRDARSRRSRSAAAAKPTPDDTTFDGETRLVAPRPRAAADICAAERPDDVNVSD
jgi:hypothetical protein